MLTRSRTLRDTGVVCWFFICPTRETSRCLTCSREPLSAQGCITNSRALSEGSRGLRRGSAGLVGLDTSSWVLSGPPLSQSVERWQTLRGSLCLHHPRAIALPLVKAMSGLCGCWVSADPSSMLLREYGPPPGGSISVCLYLGEPRRGS